MTACPLLNPLRRDGTSQRQRMPPALAADFVQIDERGTADLLRYARELAQLLRYYNEANEPAGDWAEFIERDVSTLSALIRFHDVSTPRLAFGSARDAAKAAADTATFKAAYSALFPPLFAAARTFEAWRRGSVEGMLLRSKLDRLIGSVLADALQDALRYARRAVQLGVPVTLPDLTAFGDIWGDLGVPADVSMLVSGGFTSQDERKEAVDLVRLAFERFDEAEKRVIAAAPACLEDTLQNYPRHRPHAALFLAFLELLGEARSALNTLTARHLDFYYGEVLKLVARPAVADRVHVIFDLAKKGFDRFPVDKDTALNAGKDGTGKALVFGTNAKLVVNRATIDPKHGLKTVFVDVGAGGVVRNIHAAADADSADGLGAPIEGDEPRWPTFGATSMPYARIGFAIASPMLRLAQGARTVTLRFSLEPDAQLLRGRDKALVERELRWNVIVQASGAKGWIDTAVTSATLDVAASFPSLQLVIDVPADAPAVVALDPKLHGEAFDTRYPVLRFVLDNRGLPGELLGNGRPEIPDYSDQTESFPQFALVWFQDRVYQAKNLIRHPGLTPDSHPDDWQQVEYAYPYKYFAGMRLRKLDLQVDVRDMHAMLLENDFGLLNPAKAFSPFGPEARIGASFLVGSPEAFQKRLTEFKLELGWTGCPEAGFPSHYAKYKVGTAPIVSSNSYFKADIEFLKNGAWVGKASAVPLFEPDSGKPNELRSFVLSFNAVDGELPRNPQAEPFQHFTAGLERGFLRLKLTTSFLHEMFPVLLAAFAKSTTDNVPPNPPYSPTIAGLKLGYRAKETLAYRGWKREDVENRVERIFQIGPFGQNEVVPAPAAAAVPGVVLQTTLVPEFGFDSTGEPNAGPAQGTLYLGIDAAAPPQNLALLFQMAEGSEDPMLPAQAINWSYLTDAGWADFRAAEIVADSTDRLVASGIVQLALPKSASDTSTMLPRGLRWLRATVRANSAAIPKAIAVHTQAVRASFRDHGNDAARLAAPLPAGTISKLVSREAAIKSVSQPYASFGGRMAESDAAFRVRVAERLRHKRRAVTIFDYERLVLDRFPEVYKLRCINHTDALSEYSPGAVRLAVVPNLRNRNAVDPLRPRLALARLNAIRRYVAAVASDFATVDVVNPDYEEVQVRFNVRFKPGYDKGFHTGQLEQDIIRFLTPWAYEDAVDLSFGGRVHRSAILNFIDARDYVDFVTDFEMDHIVGAQTFVNVEQAEATRSTSVLVSARKHQIGDRIVSCEDHDVAGPPSGGAAPAPAPHEPPPGDVVGEGSRYLGNVRSRELHDLQKITPDCQIDEIAIDRRYFFSRIEDAQALGYDFCAHCFGRAASKR